MKNRTNKVISKDQLDHDPLRRKLNHLVWATLFMLLCMSSVYGQVKVMVIPLFGDDAPAPTEYAIGDTGPAGGIVFDVTPDGLNGLEAAPVDQGRASWNCDDTDINGVANLANSGDLDPHSGAVITPLIAATCGEASAAATAAAYVWPNGQTAGFLPNKEELDLLYDQKVAGVVVGFASLFYWSSSQASANSACFQYFGLGDQVVSFKLDTVGVRAVRAF